VFLIDEHGVRLCQQKVLPLTLLEVRHHLGVVARRKALESSKPRANTIMAKRIVSILYSGQYASL
jgi:hypothetical protein